MRVHEARSDKPISREEERSLIARANRGDQSAIRGLIDAHKDRLFNFIWRMIRNHHDAEEVCQEAFIKAFRSLDTFKTAYRFSTWLFTIAYRICLNGMRRKQLLAGDVDLGLVASSDDQAEEQLAASEEAKYIKEAVWAAMDHLTTVQRAAVVLFYREEHSCHEIAEVLGLPVATVKSHLHRARARMRIALEADAAIHPERARILTGLAG